MTITIDYRFAFVVLFCARTRSINSNGSQSGIDRDGPTGVSVVEDERLRISERKRKCHSIEILVRY
jgi:hypothetical protein